MEFEKLAEDFSAYYPDPDLKFLKKAYDFAKEKHEHQVRASGEPYFIHVFETALIACQLKLDLDSVASALLHDVIEDCAVEYEELAQTFNPQVAAIVEGVSKLTNIKFNSKEAKQAENFRKMLVAMAQDVRVILVKLCDRLHNMRTLFHLQAAKRERIARETEEIYAPIANRLGIHFLKSELQDLCLLNLNPSVYKQIDTSFQQSKPEQDRIIEDTVSKITEHLSAAGISAKVYGRAKHYYSIWLKMVNDQITFDEINDLLGFRIIVPSVRACYESLGVMHSVWKPVPGMFKDFIAMPKPNMYQSLHTTLIADDGQRIEVQIRTPEMHQVAEEGVAAHWRYKEGNHSYGFDLQWINEMVSSQVYLKNPDEFIQSVKGELFPEDIFVFTPKGDLIRLPYGSTPIDFAYAVHTEIGHSTVGAKVNSKMVNLSTELASGDTVDVITSKNQSPKKDWLNFVKSSKSKQKIRAYLKIAERERSIDLGKELLTKELDKFKLTIKKIDKNGKLLSVLKEFNYRYDYELYADIGYGKIKIKDILKIIIPNYANVVKEIDSDDITPLERIFRKAATVVKKERPPVKIAGLDNVLLRFARCCQPLSGDRITGYVTRGRGVSIHRVDCLQVLNADPHRLIKVDWEGELEEARTVNIRLTTTERVGLLAEVSKVISDMGITIVYSDSKVDSERCKAILNFKVNVYSSEEYDDLRRSIEMIPGVIKLERILEN